MENSICFLQILLESFPYHYKNLWKIQPNQDKIHRFESALTKPPASKGLTILTFRPFESLVLKWIPDVYLVLIWINTRLIMCERRLVCTSKLVLLCEIFLLCFCLNPDKTGSGKFIDGKTSFNVQTNLLSHIHYVLGVDPD